MTKEQLKEISYFPVALDKTVNDKFGEDVQCKSELNLITLTYITTFNGNVDKRVRVQNFIDGYVAGNRELAERLYKMTVK